MEITVLPTLPSLGPRRRLQSHPPYPVSVPDEDCSLTYLAHFAPQAKIAVSPCLPSLGPRRRLQSHPSCPVPAPGSLTYLGQFGPQTEIAVSPTLPSLGPRRRLQSYPPCPVWAPDGDCSLTHLAQFRSQTKICSLTHLAQFGPQTEISVSPTLPSSGPKRRLQFHSPCPVWAPNGDCSLTHLAKFGPQAVATLNEKRGSVYEVVVPSVSGCYAIGLARHAHIQRRRLGVSGLRGLGHCEKDALLCLVSDQ